MLETSDLNDKDILEATRQESGANGSCRFKITLPDGHKLTSEWIAPDNKKQALRAWLEVVKETAAARSRARQEELNAHIRRQQQERDRSLIELPPGVIASDPSNDAQVAAVQGSIAGSMGGNGAIDLLRQQAAELRRKAKALEEAAELLEKSGV